MENVKRFQEKIRLELIVFLRKAAEIYGVDGQPTAKVRRAGPILAAREHKERKEFTEGKGVARNPGKPVILSEAKNLAGITKILRCAQNDKFAKKNCRT
jgi:hypothetical protein